MKIEKLLQFVCLQFCFCGCFSVFSPREIFTQTFRHTCEYSMNMYEWQRQTATETATQAATVFCASYE